MRRLDWTGKVATCAVFVCAAIETHTLVDRSRGEPRNLGIRRYVLGEIYEGYRVEERFWVKADGLSSVTIYPRPAAPAPTGNVMISLYDVTDDRARLAVRQVSVPTAELSGADSLTLRFPPQRSVYREYVLEVSVVDGSDGQGIGLLATRGAMSTDTYRRFVNGRLQFGNLAFKTTVDGATSNFGSIASQLAERGVPGARFVLALVLMLKSAALWFIIRAVARSADDSTLEAQTPPSLPA